jgi:uncharacterized metal-binding protein
MSDCCAQRKVLVFACSGGSNVGQLSNEAAKKLDVEGVGSFFCMAGVGGGIAGIIGKSKEADATIVIDGCDVGCVKAAFEREGVDISKYVVITDLGIEKGHHFNLTDEQIESVCAAAKKTCCCG